MYIFSDDTLQQNPFKTIFLPVRFGQALARNCNPDFSLDISSSFFKNAVIRMDAVSSLDTIRLGETRIQR